MPNARFLETYPLYRKFPTKIPQTMNGLPSPAVHMYCKICNSDQTFNQTNSYSENVGYVNCPCQGEIVRVVYQCKGCETFHRYFLVKLGDKLDYVMKVGQYPSWEISPAKDLARFLGEHKLLYRRALTCESQGYGIAAYAYYRRIVEGIIDNLLSSVADLLAGKERETYLEVFEKVKATTITQEKIDLVKDMLPAILRPDNMNPLMALHQALSEGLHGKGDEECLDLAETIREVLVFLVQQVLLAKESSKHFTSGMRKFLDKAGKKGT